MGGHAGEVGGRQGDCDHGVREHEDQPGETKNRKAWRVSSGSERGDVGLNDTGDLRHEDHAKHPGDCPTGAPESYSSPVEVRPERKAGFSPEEEKNQGLCCHTRSCRTSQNGDHSWRPHQRIRGVYTGEENTEGHESRHGDDVVECWSPGEGAKNFAGVEHFTQQTVERIKQHLR